MNRNRWAPVAAVAAVLAVVAGYSLLSRDASTADPPVLRLAAARDSYAAMASGAGGSYRLVGTLPDGPSAARVRNLSATAVPVARVRALAATLGETAAPVRITGAWKAGDLVVRDEPGNPWTWGATCGPDTPVPNGGVVTDRMAAVCDGATVSSGGGTVSSGGGVSSGTGSISGDPLPCISTVGGTGCSVPGSVGTPSPVLNCLVAGPPCSKPTNAPCLSQPSGSKSAPCGDPAKRRPLPVPPMPMLVTKSQALAATASVRGALGLGDAPTRVEGLSVIVEPLAGGLPTNGMATVLQLSGRASLVSASGSLSTGREGDLYPLRSARKAFDGIPVMAIGAPCSAATGCPQGPVITGARLGLSRVDLDKGAAALVPAWLFTVKGSQVPLVAIAVADRFLAGPSATRTIPGAEPGTSGSGTAEPGIGAPGSRPRTTEPGPDGSMPPAPASTVKPSVASGREVFGFDGAYADADPKVLVIRYGDSGSCPSQAVRQDVLEQPDRVVVTLTRTPMPADQACTMDYRAKLLRVALKAPLGGRAVVDGFRKEPVPLSTGTPPFG